MGGAKRQLEVDGSASTPAQGVLDSRVEVTIAGRLQDMFAALVPANDLTFRYGINAPTVRIDGLTVAGV